MLQYIFFVYTTMKEWVYAWIPSNIQQIAYIVSSSSSSTTVVYKKPYWTQRETLSELSLQDDGFYSITLWNNESQDTQSYILSHDHLRAALHLTSLNYVGCVAEEAIVQSIDVYVQINQNKKEHLLDIVLGNVSIKGVLRPYLTTITMRDNLTPSGLVQLYQHCQPCQPCQPRAIEKPVPVPLGPEIETLDITDSEGEPNEMITLIDFDMETRELSCASSDPLF